MSTMLRNALDGCSRIACTLLTAFVAANVVTIPGALLEVAGWHVDGLPTAWLSWRDIARIVLTASIATWWLAPRVRHLALRTGVRLMRYDVPVPLVACIAALRTNELLGPLALMVGYVVWLPCVLALIDLPERENTCTSPAAAKGISEERTPKRRIPGNTIPHLPISTTPLIACCIVLCVIACHTRVLSNARVLLDGAVHWSNSQLQVLAVCSAVCTWSAIALLAHLCRTPFRQLAIILPAAALACSLGLPSNASVVLSSWELSVMIACAVVIYLQAMRITKLEAAPPSPFAVLDRQAGVLFLPVAFAIAAAISSLLPAGLTEGLEPLLVLEVAYAGLVAKAWNQSRSVAQKPEHPRAPSNSRHDIDDEYSAAANRACDQNFDLIAKRYGLTAREATVIAAMVGGDSLSTIAQAENIGKSTVGTYAARAYAKLGVSSRHDAIEFIEHELRNLTASVEDALDGTARTDQITRGASVDSTGHHRASNSLPQNQGLSKWSCPRVVAFLDIAAWSFITGALVLPWLGGATSPLANIGAPMPAVAVLLLGCLATANTRKRRQHPGPEERQTACGGALIALVPSTLVAACLLCCMLPRIAFHTVGQEAASLIIGCLGAAASLLTLKFRAHGWCRVLRDGELLAANLLSAAIFGCLMRTPLLVPTVFLCAILEAVIALFGGNANSASDLPAAPAYVRSLSAGSFRPFRMGIGMVRSVILVLTGVALGLIYLTLAGSHVALRPPLLVTALVWQLLTQGLLLGGLLCLLRRIFAFAERSGTEPFAIMLPTIAPLIIGFCCCRIADMGAYQNAPFDESLLGALVTLAICCGAGALRSIAQSYRARASLADFGEHDLAQTFAEERLTNTELVVLALLLRGNTAADISRKLVVSLNTARTHIRHLYTKLGVHSKSELSLVARERLKRYEERL